MSNATPAEDHEADPISLAIDTVVLDDLGGPLSAGQRTVTSGEAFWLEAGERFIDAGVRVKTDEELRDLFDE